LLVDLGRRGEDRHETGPCQNEKAEHERLGSVDHCGPLRERRGRTVPVASRTAGTSPEAMTPAIWCYGSRPLP
jgi:hypothetical protein